MGIRKQKDEKKVELNIDFTFNYNPIILTNEFLGQTLNGCKYKKSSILLPAEHIQVLEHEKFKISEESDYALDNGFREETLQINNYFLNLLHSFQKFSYLEFAIASPYGIEHYTPRKELQEFYSKNSQLKLPLILSLGEIIPNSKQLSLEKSFQDLFEIKQIKTQKELSLFQTANHPRKQYLSIGTLNQLNPTLKSPTQNEITNMALQFIDKKLKNSENLEIKIES